MMKKWLVGSIVALAISYVTFIYFLGNQMKRQSPSLSVEVNWMISSSLIFVCLILILLTVVLLWTRQQVKTFTNEASVMMDKVMNQEDVVFTLNEETLLSKLNGKLKQLTEVMKHREQSYELEKNNIKELIGDISHQIKTPLANLTMYNETLLSRELEPDKQKMCLTVMQSQIQKLDHLVAALIKMSRLENGVIQLSKSKVLASELVSSSVSGLTLKAFAKDISIEVMCDPSLIITCDKSWTGEALFNLLENAVKYTPAGGQIKVTVEESDMFTSFHVSDTGMGIDQQEVNDIFKRFYRANDVRQLEGVGIGLYLVREIISKQTGYVKVKSQKGQGSTFSIYLPK